MIFRHCILTRFNLFLWNNDKEGYAVRTVNWLEHRFHLFERFCLPSIENQTCKEFDWIVLFDSKTPDRFKAKIYELKLKCPQLVPVFVEPENGRYYAEIFRREVTERILQVDQESGREIRVITTYLDNDDSLDKRFVEDLQLRAAKLPDGSFINYTHGYQFFTSYSFMMRVHYPRNHFISVVEQGDPATLKTIYGYGSHYYIDKIKGVRIENVENCPMWCEVIHEKNMGNDAYFLFGAKMVKDESLLATDFGVQEEVKFGLGLYLFRFIPRYVKTLYRRVGYKVFGRNW